VKPSASNTGAQTKDEKSDSNEIAPRLLEDFSIGLSLNRAVWHASPSSFLASLPALSVKGEVRPRYRKGLVLAVIAVLAFGWHYYFRREARMIRDANRVVNYDQMTQFAANYHLKVISLFPGPGISTYACEYERGWKPLFHKWIVFHWALDDDSQVYQFKESTHTEIFGIRK
jgi:hypothetical protein